MSKPQNDGRVPATLTFSQHDRRKASKQRTLERREQRQRKQFEQTVGRGQRIARAVRQTEWRVW